MIMKITLSEMDMAELALGAAISKVSGFDRVEVDPDHVIELVNRVRDAERSLARCVIAQYVRVINANS